MVEIKWYHHTNDLNDAHRLRQTVFIDEQGISEAYEWDQNDFEAYHVVVYEEGKPVATGRLVVDGTYYLIGRIAALKECRGKKFGDLVVSKLLEKCISLGAQEVHVSAQVRAIPFYEKMGFHKIGKEYKKENIPHIDMVK